MNIPQSDDEVSSFQAKNYEVKGKDYLKRGLEIFKASPFELVMSGVLAFICGIILNKIPRVGFILNLPFTAFVEVGYFILITKTANSQKVVLPDFFKVFDLPKEVFFTAIMQIIINYAFTLVLLIPIIIFAIWYVITAGDTSIFMAPLGNITSKEVIAYLSKNYLILIVGIVYLLVIGFSVLIVNLLMIFSVLIKMETKLGIKNSFIVSFRLMSKKIFTWAFSYLFLIIIGLFVIIFTLGFGVLFLGPLYKCVVYAAYEDLRGAKTLEAEIV